jgi:hypothetical protein
MHEDLSTFVVDLVNKHLPAGATILTDPSAILDASVYERNGMFMFGSHKQGMPPYEVQDVYRLAGKHDKTGIPVPYTFAMGRDHEVGARTTLDRLSLRDTDHESSMSLTPHGEARMTKMDEERAEREKDRLADLRDQPFAGQDDGTLKRGEELQQLLAMLSPNRGSIYSDWFSVMCACVNSFGPQSWHLFNDWSMQYTTSYNFRKNREIFDRIVSERGTRTGKKATVKRLHEYAKQDSPVPYRQLVDAKVIGRELYNADAGRVAIYKHLFGDDMVCVDIQKKRFRKLDPKTKLWKNFEKEQVMDDLSRIQPHIAAYVKDTLL